MKLKYEMKSKAVTRTWCEVYEINKPSGSAEYTMAILNFIAS